MSAAAERVLCSSTYSLENLPNRQRVCCAVRYSYSGLVLVSGALVFEGRSWSKDTEKFCKDSRWCMRFKNVLFFGNDYLRVCVRVCVCVDRACV